MWKIHQLQNYIHGRFMHFGLNRFLTSTPRAVVIGSLIIAGSIVAHGYIVRGTASETPIQLFAGKPIDNTDFVEGKKDSKVALVEYSDPECPFCVSVSPTMKELRNTYGDRIAFVYRHFPLTQIHPNAFDESKAIACAGILGGEKKYYEYINNLYGYKYDNKTTQLPTTGKQDLARNIGLDVNAFTMCLANQATENIVGNSINDGITAGVQGTPSSYVLLKGRTGYEIIAMIDGARSLEYFKAAIEEALSR